MDFTSFDSIIGIANLFISLFVLIYAWSFLKQTADVRDRKPWVFLFIATIVFFIFELVGVIDLFHLSEVPGVTSLFETIFIALILFVFIFQYDLILKSDLILITRKMAEEEDIDLTSAHIIKEARKTSIKKENKNKTSHKKK